MGATDTRLYTPFINTYYLTATRTKKQLMMNTMTVDKALFSTLGIGWKIPPAAWKQPVASEIRVYNQQAVKEAGEMVKALLHPNPYGNGADVAGITQDFNFFGLQRQQSPVMLSVVSDTSRAVVANGGYLLVKLNPGQDVPVVLGQLKLLYDQASRSDAIANVSIAGKNPAELAKALFEQYKIFTVAIDSANVHGVCVTPHAYTTIAELDAFVRVLREMAA